MSKMSEVDILVQDYEACMSDRDKAQEEVNSSQGCMDEIKKELEELGYRGELKSTNSL